MWGWEQLYFNIKDGYLGKFEGRHVLEAGAGCGLNGASNRSGCSATPPENTLGLMFLLHTEAIVRGHKSGLLTIPDYNNLTQCEALDDIKLNLVSAAAARAGSDEASSCLNVSHGVSSSTGATRHIHPRGNPSRMARVAAEAAGHPPRRHPALCRARDTARASMCKC